MIQAKEELFIAELGGNPQQEIELSYGAKIKITDLLSKYLEAINWHLYTTYHKFSNANTAGDK